MAMAVTKKKSGSAFGIGISHYRARSAGPTRLRGHRARLPVIARPPFVFDDRTTVLLNPSLVEPWDVRALFFQDPPRAVVNLSYTVDRAFWGFSSTGFHLTNHPPRHRRRPLLRLVHPVRRRRLRPKGRGRGQGRVEWARSLRRRRSGCTPDGRNGCVRVGAVGAAVRSGSWPRSFTRVARSWRRARPRGSWRRRSGRWRSGRAARPRGCPSSSSL